MEPTLFDQIDMICTKHPCFGRYHNSVNISGEELKKRERRTESQNDKILKFFQRHDSMNFAAWEVYKYMKLPNVPITSIRRAITDLEKAGCLVKTENKRIGIYGDKCICWKLK